MKTNLSTKKNYFIVIVFTVILAMLAILCFATKYFYNYSYTQSQKELAAGMNAFNAGDWQVAWHHSEVLTNYYALSPLSYSPEAKTLKDQSSLMVYGDNMRKQKGFRSALEAYDTYFNLYPESAEQVQIKTIMSELYLELGKQLGENNQLEQQLETLNKIITDYPDSQEAVEARLLLVNAYDALGKKYIEEKSFLLAIKTYSAAKELASDHSLKSIVDNGYQIALQGLANDDGIEGQQIIAETLASVCGGKRATSPSIGILNEQPARGLACDALFDFPVEWQAKTPGSLQFIIRVSYSYVDEQICYYSKDGTVSPGESTYELVVQSEEATVTVYNAETGGRIDSETFSSPSNFQCPDQREFSGLTEHVSGEKTKEQDILDWLGKYFE